jgi:hypothetical protein
MFRSEYFHVSLNQKLNIKQNNCFKVGLKNKEKKAYKYSFAYVIKTINEFINQNNEKLKGYMHIKTKIVKTSL